MVANTWTLSTLVAVHQPLLGLASGLSIYDGLGLIGVGLLLGFQAAVQLGRLNADSLAYSVGNAVGAGLVVLSLCFQFNLSAFVVESVWTLVSLVGIGRHLLRRRRLRFEQGRSGPSSAD